MSNSFIELFQPETWDSKVVAVLRKNVPPAALTYLKDFPGEDMYSDTMDYMNKAYARARRRFLPSVREQLIEAVWNSFSYLRSFHGCRPSSFESYRESGLLVLTRERLARIAYEVFEKTIPLEELQQMARTADLKTRLGNVYFCADANALVSDCGHYLIYGSESLNCLWHSGSPQDSRRFVECRERQRDTGIPTVLDPDSL